MEQIKIEEENEGEVIEKEVPEGDQEQEASGESVLETTDKTG